MSSTKHTLEFWITRVIIISIKNRFNSYVYFPYENIVLVVTEIVRKTFYVNGIDMIHIMKSYTINHSRFHIFIPITKLE